ncbi:MULTISPECIES: BON domain-containing protein [Comamonas]|uniref:BON domain-containing protein n=1 Tax=Comamonas TaxID=283 RepID=UPI0024487DD3|nr:MULTISPECIES: BON domain-containing protein [Comamonas]MDH1703950.1 BON domain-containing protein [Comamonas terrigena]MDI9856591.1 BON domain-containing protein [Comamonas sp. 17RB]
MKRMGSPLVRAVLAAAAITAGLSGCVPLVVGGGMATAALSAADRRTTGTQVEDQGIELRAQDRIRQSPLNERSRVNITSFNRKVLITGEVRNEQDKQEVARIVRDVNNVDGIHNELEVTPFSSSLGQRSKDTLLTSQVKGSLINSRDLQASAIKVVTEMNVVYLLGIVTERESRRAAEIARGVNDVRKVVRVFELTTEDALANYMPGSAPVTRDPAAEN